MNEVKPQTVTPMYVGACKPSNRGEWEYLVWILTTHDRAMILSQPWATPQP